MSPNEQRLQVKPIYGWGWRKAGNDQAVPGPFQVRITHTKYEDNELKVAFGQIVEAAHELEGQWIGMTKRSDMEDGVHCNVLIKASTPPWDSDGRLRLDNETTSGFAVITNKPSSP